MRKSILILVTIFFTAGFLVQPRLEAQISISKSVLSNGGVVISNGEFTNGMPETEGINPKPIIENK